MQEGRRGLDQLRLSPLEHHRTRSRGSGLERRRRGEGILEPLEPRGLPGPQMTHLGVEPPRPLRQLGDRAGHAVVGGACSLGAELGQSGRRG